MAGVERTTVASSLPGRDHVPALLRAGNSRTAKGATIAVGESFFETLGLPLVAGRGFDRTEDVQAAPVAVVSESVAATLWPGESAIGKELSIPGPGGASRLLVIGVSRNAIEFGGLGVLTAGDVYRPMDSAAPGDAYLLVRTTRARASLRAIAGAIRPSHDAPMPRPAVFADVVAYFPQEGTSVLHMFVAFALVALLLAATGIFGVVNQSVSQRTTELGVRMALGATRRQVLRLVVLREGKLILAAIACGAVGTVAVTRMLFAELVTMSALRPAAPALLLMVCGAAAGLAVAFATWRIVKLQPWKVLRHG